MYDLNHEWTLSIESRYGQVSVNLTDTDGIAAGFVASFVTMRQYMENPVAAESVWFTACAPFLSLVTLLYNSSVDPDIMLGDTAEVAISAETFGTVYQRTVKLVQGPDHSMVEASSLLLAGDGFDSPSTLADLERAVPSIDRLGQDFELLSRNDLIIVNNLIGMAQSLLSQLISTVGGQGLN